MYLGRYLYRGVIQEKDILICKDGMVSFRYRNSKTGKLETRTVGGAQFLRLVLQHILPKAFAVPAIMASCTPTAKARLRYCNYD